MDIKEATEVLESGKLTAIRNAILEVLTDRSLLVTQFADECAAKNKAIDERDETNARLEDPATSR